MLKRFLKDTSGATSIEYALIGGAMALALIAAMPFITTAIETKFTSIGTALSK